MPNFEEITPKEFEQERQSIHNSGFSFRFSWITLQAIICIFALCALLALKLFVPNVFEAFDAWYNMEMERSVLIEYDAITNL